MISGLNSKYERAIKAILAGSSGGAGVTVGLVRRLIREESLSDFLAYTESRYGELFTLVMDDKYLVPVMDSRSLAQTGDLPLSQSAVVLALYAWKYQVDNSRPVPHTHLVEVFSARYRGDVSRAISRAMTALEACRWIREEQKRTKGGQIQRSYRLTGIGRSCLGAMFLKDVILRSQGREFDQGEIERFFGDHLTAAKLGEFGSDSTQDQDAGSQGLSES